MKRITMLTLCSLAGLLGVAAFVGCGGSDNGSASTPQVYTQMDRLARPAVNEVLATVAGNRHQINDTDNPTDDATNLKQDIVGFMNFPAGRDAATQNALASVLVPDVMVADLTQSGPAAYLGVESGGATGGKFGGRKLTDDVVDIDLGAIFGNTLSALGVVPDDHHELPQYTSDNVDATTAPKHYQDGSAGFGAAAFPYLGPPQ
ncbi:MAG TPA: DUF4331 family protein [Chthonomonadaceae bacterium]|nr:DUF4331 family protein [Chthonomonadaceae bacterium]